MRAGAHERAVYEAAKARRAKADRVVAEALLGRGECADDLAEALCRRTEAQDAQDKAWARVKAVLATEAP